MSDKTGYVEKNTGDCVGVEVIDSKTGWEVVGGLIANTAVGEG